MYIRCLRGASSWGWKCRKMTKIPKNQPEVVVEVVVVAKGGAGEGEGSRLQQNLLMRWRLMGLVEWMERDPQKEPQKKPQKKSLILVERIVLVQQERIWKASLRTLWFNLLRLSKRKNDRKGHRRLRQNQRWPANPNKRRKRKKMRRWKRKKMRRKQTNRRRREDSKKEEPEKDQKKDEKHEEKETKPRTISDAQVTKAKHELEMYKEDPAGWAHVIKLFDATKIPERDSTPKYMYWAYSMYWGTRRVGLLQKQPSGKNVHYSSFGGGHCTHIGIPTEACKMLVGALIGILLVLFFVGEMLFCRNAQRM